MRRGPASEREAEIRRQQAAVELLTAIGMLAAMAWQLTPRHQREAWRMAAAAALQRRLRRAARRTGQAAMRRELRTGAADYALPYVLGLAADEAGGWYDAARSVTP